MGGGGGNKTKAISMKNGVKGVIYLLQKNKLGGIQGTWPQGGAASKWHGPGYSRTALPVFLPFWVMTSVERLASFGQPG